MTPLHLGVISGNSRIVKRLLLKGANKKARDNSGKTPADIARENEYFNIMSMIQQKKGFL